MVALLALLRGPILRAIGNWLIVADEPVASELVVALGGQSGYRVHKAAELVAAGFAPKVGLTGPDPAFPEFEEPSYVRWLSLLTISMAVVWILAARYAGRRFETLEQVQARALRAPTDGVGTLPSSTPSC